MLATGIGYITLRTTLGDVRGDVGLSRLRISTAIKICALYAKVATLPILSDALFADNDRRQNEVGQDLSCFFFVSRVHGVWSLETHVTAVDCRLSNS